MASEPRNYPDYVFVAYDEDFSAQTYDIAVSLEPGNLVGRPVKYIRHDLSTRSAPAATDTGLVTVGHMVSHDAELGPVEDAVVYRSQAEELLAAERSRADANFDKAIEQGKRAVDLEAKLAAKDARIKDLTGDRDSWRRVAEKLAGEKQALEAKLAAATDLISRAKEIIPDSYINWHDFARAALGGKP